MLCKSLDYQWPSNFLKKRKLTKNKIKNKLLIKKIENFFFKKYGYSVVLLPSARSCLSIIIDYFKISRSEEVIYNKFSSSCIIKTISHYSNPTLVSSRDTSMIVVDNKWGIKKLVKKNKSIIIEDSADTIHLKKKAFFFNNSDIEIISLPKIIGSIGGGLIVTKNINLLKFCKKKQFLNRKKGLIQTALKFKRDFMWENNEITNTYCDEYLLNDIFKNLKNFEINKKIILERLDFLKNHFKLKTSNLNIGPVVPIKIKNKNKIINNVMIRNYNFEKKLPYKFSKAYLIPLHFKISNDMFQRIYQKIIKQN